MLKLKTGSNTVSDTLTRDPETRFHFWFKALTDYKFFTTKIIAKHYTNAYKVMSIFLL